MTLKLIAYHLYIYFIATPRTCLFTYIYPCHCICLCVRYICVLYVYFCSQSCAVHCTCSHMCRSHHRIHRGIFCRQVTKTNNNRGQCSGQYSGFVVSSLSLYPL